MVAWCFSALCTIALTGGLRDSASLEIGGLTNPSSNIFKLNNFEMQFAGFEKWKFSWPEFPQKNSRFLFACVFGCIWRGERRWFCSLVIMLWLFTLFLFLVKIPCASHIVRIQDVCNIPGKEYSSWKQKSFNQGSRPIERANACELPWCKTAAFQNQVTYA